MTKQRLTLIQPHSGELILSAANLLLSEEYDVKVVMLENSERDRKLFDFIQVPYKVVDVEFEPKDSMNYKGKQAIEEAELFLSRVWGRDTLNELEYQMMDAVTQIWWKNKDVTTVVPLGLDTALDLFVRETVEKYYSVLEYYREYRSMFLKKLPEWMTFYFRTENNDISSFVDVKAALIRKFYGGYYDSHNVMEEVYMCNEQDLPF